MAFFELTPLLRSLKSSSSNIADDFIDVIETRFCQYDRTSSLTKVDDVLEKVTES